MELLGAAAAILGKREIAAIRESERSVGAEGSRCRLPSVARLEKELSSSGRCRTNRSDRLDAEGVPARFGRR